ncbi:SHOCT domain-containing protein [Candidatus Saccharibacteria bacterium]|nr:SHOCT domain-containing protein [Candidatus Saccharibacteria bacterium]
MHLAHYSDGFHMDAGDWGFGLLMMLFWALVVITIVVLLIRGIVGSSDKQGKDEDSLTIAKNRYAKGEITKKEFEQLIEDLSSK